MRCYAKKCCGIRNVLLIGEDIGDLGGAFKITDGFLADAADVAAAAQALLAY